MMFALTLLAVQSHIVLAFERDVLLTDSGAVVLLAPLHIGGPKVVRTEWSPDGKLLVFESVDGADSFPGFETSPESTETCVSVWNPNSRKAVEVFRRKGVDVVDIVWMAGNGLYAIVAEALPSGPTRPEPVLRQSLMRWSQGSATMTLALPHESPASASSAMRFDASPKRPYGLLSLSAFEDGKGHGWVITPTTAKPIDLPFGWIAADKAGNLTLNQYLKGPTLKDRKESWARLEPDGTWTPLPTRPDYADKRQPPDPNRNPEISKNTAIYGPVTVKLVDGWLTGRFENKPSAALVSADASGCDLSPDGKFVMFQSQGSLFARALKPISLADYDKMYEAAERMELLSRVKQIGVAAQIYAADNDDRFPPKQNFSNLLYPYTKSAEFFQGFAYEMDGENARDLKDPANTVMGYIQGKNGKAVVYADSHAKWIKNP